MITDEQIKQGLDKAYKEAGHNAYFGNGFQAGVKFALEQVKNCSIPDVSNCDAIFEQEAKLTQEEIEEDCRNIPN